MGIVSSIGNQHPGSAVEPAGGQVRHTHLPQVTRSSASVSQVYGAPTVNAAEMIDRRAMRFLARCRLESHRMEQAIQDSGSTVRGLQCRTGIIMGSAGRRAHIVESADTTRPRGPSGRSVCGAEGDVVDGVRHAPRPVQDSRA